jgi:hypothetical protein
MMKRLFAIRRDDRGAAAIEMAIAMPLLVLFLWGIFQVGVAFQANAGMQHALGEGARYATLCVNPNLNTGCNTPSNTLIENRIKDKVFGTKVGEFEDPSVTNGPANSGYKTLSVTFTMQPDFLFFQGPPINITQTKRVYVAGA